MILFCRTLFFVSLVVGFNSLIAQNRVLNGRILYLNSGTKPAVGIAIYGQINNNELSNTVYSTSEGLYALVFPVPRVGYNVDLFIDTFNRYGDEIEIVNTREIKNCNLPADGSSEFNIIVCPKGARNLAARKYYMILKSATEEKLLVKEKEYEILRRKSEFASDKIDQLLIEIEILKNQNDSLKTYKEALRIASINQDFASKRVKLYLQKLDSGESIFQARKELSIDDAFSEAKASNKSLKQSIEELNFRANASLRLLDFSDAVACKQRIIEILEDLGSIVNASYISTYYIEIGEIYRLVGANFKAFKTYEKVLELYEEFGSDEIPEVCLALSELSIMPMSYEKSLPYALKGLSYYDKSNSTNVQVLVDLLHSTAVNEYVYYNNHKKALEYYDISLDVINSNQNIIALESIIVSLTTIAEIHLTEKDSVRARFFINKAKDVVSQRGEDFKILYEYLPGLFKLEVIDEMIDANLKQLKKTNLGTSDTGVDSISTLLNIVDLFLDKMDTISAKYFSDIALSKIESTYSESASLGVIQKYRHIGDFFVEMGIPQRALECYKICANYFGERGEVLSENNYAALDKIATIYTQTLINQDSALVYYKKALAVLQSYGINNPRLASIYYDIGALYDDVGKDSISLKYYNDAVVYAERNNIGYDIYLPMLETLCLKYEEMNRIASGIVWIKKWDKMNEVVYDDLSEKKGDAYYIFGVALFENNFPTVAKQFLLKARKVVKDKVIKYDIDRRLEKYNRKN